MIFRRRIQSRLPANCPFCHIKYNQRIYTIRDFGGMDEIMFYMDDSLLSVANDFYQGSGSWLDAVKAGGAGAKVLHTEDYQKWPIR
jgi:hypothetical protein